MGIIRFLLAVAVVFTHAGHAEYMGMVGGKLAVELFYIFSGFYMALILTEKYVGLKTYKVFITNRMLKLYPIYWAVALLVILFSLYMAYDTDWRVWGILHYYKVFYSKLSFFTVLFLIVSNVFVFFQDWIMFLGVSLKSGHLFFTPDFLETYPRLHYFLLVPQAWTIGLELTFYLLVPFIARKNISWLILIGLASLACKILLALNGYSHDPWTYRFFFSELHLFILGMLAYRLYNMVKSKLLNKSLLYSILAFDVLIILLCEPIRLLLGNQTDTIYLIIFFASLPFVFHLSKQWRFDSKIGELSYPIYISHGFVILVYHYYFQFSTKSTMGWTTVVTTIFISILLNYLILRPIDRYRQNRVKKS